MVVSPDAAKSSLINSSALYFSGNFKGLLLYHGPLESGFVPLQARLRNNSGNSSFHISEDSKPRL